MKYRIGLAIIIIGIGHTSLGIYRFYEVFGTMFQEGLLATGAGEVRGWAFWFTFAGVLMISLGLLVRAFELEGLRVPVHVGWFLLVGSLIGVAVYPLSGFWLMLAVTFYIIFGQQESVT